MQHWPRTRPSWHHVCGGLPHRMLWPLLLLCYIARAQSSIFTAEMLLKAVNKVYEPGGTYADQPAVRYNDWLHEVPARLRAHKVWWSSKTPANATLTVATVTNFDRLNQLEAQCSSWAGPLSAVVYVPIKTAQDAPANQSTAEAGKLLKNAEKQVQEMVTKIEQAAGTGCYLDVQLLYEAISPDPLMDTMFPVNSLRNFALMAARTPLVAMIDVDLLVSSSMAEWLKAPDNTQQLLQRCKDKAVVVLPAFETEEFEGSLQERHLQTFYKVAAVAVQFDKRTVLAAMRKQGLIHPFDWYTHQTGHADTDYDRWDNSSQMYVANLTSPDYEPWFIIGRHQVPLYDVRYRGFGRNKMVHIQDLKQQRYQFYVHPEAFLLHRPHAKAKASRTFMQKDERGVVSNPMRRNMFRFFDSHMKQLQSGTYRPCVDDALLNCHNTLPWAFKIPDPKCIPYVLPEDRDKPFNTSDDAKQEQKRQKALEMEAKAAAAKGAGGTASTAASAPGAANAAVPTAATPAQPAGNSGSGSMLGSGQGMDAAAQPLPTGANAATASNGSVRYSSGDAESQAPAGTTGSAQAQAAAAYHGQHHRPHNYQQRKLKRSLLRRS